MAWNPFKRSSAEKAARPVLSEADVQPKKKRSLFSRSFGMFKSSKIDENDRWSGTLITPDAFITQRQPILVARSREQWSNNDYVRAFIRLVRQNVVGPMGVTMQAKVSKPRGGLDKEANEAIEADWRDFSKKGNCDVTGKLSLREIECMVIETTARDGEFFARKIYGANAGPHSFALQLIDPQRCPVWYENGRQKGTSNFIRHGIEYNQFGRVVAYHFTSTDEGDATFYYFGGTGFVRVPADQIIYDFVHEMVAQKRGLPWASTSLFRLHHLQGFEDASVQNARAGATQMGFIEYDEGFGPELEDDQPLSIDAEPLSFQELPEGAHIKDWKPTYPNGEFETFHKAMLRGAAAGMGVLYNNMAGDLEGVNFSSIRQGTLDEREHYKELQQWLIEALLEPVYNEWLKYRLLSGGIKTKNGKSLPAEKLESFKSVSWQPRRWQWIDPSADVTAGLESIRGGVQSPSQFIREQGRDPDDVFAEIASDMAAMKAAGIPPEFIDIFFGKKQFPEPPPAAAAAKA